MSDLDKLATDLAQALKIFVLEADQEVPAPILAAQCDIVRRTATELGKALTKNPQARVRIDHRLPVHMEEVWLRVLGPPNTKAPDFPDITEWGDDDSTG